MATNYLFPLPLPMHIAFCVISFLFFGAQYLRKKYTYHLLLAFAVPSTLLIYACSSDWAFGVFGFEQFVLYALILISIFLTKKKTAKEEEQSKKLLEESSDENSPS